MTPEEEKAFRAKMAASPAPEEEPGLGGRIAASAGRLADHPAVRIGLGGIAGPAGAVGALMLPNVRQERSMQSFERTDPASEVVEAPGGLTLRPMQSYAPEPNAAPTLDPRYGQLATPRLGGGGPGVGSGLKADLDKARQRQLGLMDTEASLARELGVDQAAKTMAVSDLEQQQAAEQRAAAERQARIDEDAHQRHTAFLDKQQALADELGKMKVDSKRMLRDADGGTKFSMWTGAILGGMLGAEHGTGNTSLDRLEKIIDRDVKLQQDEIDNKKAQISARSGIFGQMLSETGDARVAAAATRNLLLEAAKLDLKAKADQLGTPEMRTRAEIAANAIEQKQAALRTAIAEGALKAAQAAAAAAQAARERAEEKAWQRAKDMAELELKRGHLAIEAGKGGKETDKEDNAAISEASKRLGDDKIIANRELINSLASKIRSDGTVVGLDRGAALREKLLRYSPTGLVMSDDLIRRGALSDDERITQQQWEQAKLAFQTKVTGTGGSDAQMEAIGRAFDGAKSDAEKVAAIRSLQGELQRREALARAGLTDEQRVKLDARLGREGQKGDLPNSVRAK